jgi:outer membrane cobalamin receptor
MAAYVTAKPSRGIVIPVTCWACAVRFPYNPHRNTDSVGHDLQLGGTMRLVVVTLILLTATLPAASQDAPAQIIGTVRDALGTPLEGVTVALARDAVNRTATTDQDGRYRIDGIPPNRYQVSARGERLGELTRDVVVTAGAIVEVDFELKPAFADTVIVTAIRGEQSLISAPASVSVLGSHDIAVSAADNVPDMLRRVPGLNVAQFSARDMNINTRSSTGILSNSMLVLVDGRAFFQPLYGAVYWDLLTLTKDEIGQIEVLRSPASAMWGANALNGVVNIRTKSPRQVPAFSGQLAVGERGTKSASVFWADATDRLSYKLSGSYFEQDAWDRDNRLPDGSAMPPDVIFANRGTKQPKFDARVDWDGDSSRVWSLRGGVAGANGLTHSALGPGEFESGSYYNYVELDRSSDDLDVKVYWNRLEAPFRIVLFGLDEQATNDTFVAEAIRRLSVGDRHDLTFGGSLKWDRFDVSIAPDESKRVEGAAFIEDSVRVGPKVSLVIGGRLDKFDTTSAVFAPRLGVVLTPQPAHSFRVTYNRAFRAPSLLENFIKVTLPAVVPLERPFFYTQLVLGSTELKMEQQDAFEVGYTGVINGRTTVFATVYNQRISNDIWFLPASFYGPGAPPPGWPGDPFTVPLLPSVFTFVNLGEVRDRGIELAAQVDWAPVSFQASYTFQDTPRLDSGTNLPLQINRPPRQQGGAGVTYSATRWNVGGDVHYTGRAFWADVFTEQFWGYTDAYVAVNARASYRLPNRAWELWVSATNLSDEKIKSHVFGDTIRRKITGGVRWQWERR